MSSSYYELPLLEGFTYEKYEHPTPPVLESCWWDAPVKDPSLEDIAAFHGVSVGTLEQLRLKEEDNR